MHRKKLNASVTIQNLKSYTSAFNEISKKHVASYKEFSDSGKPMIIVPNMTHVLLDFVFKNVLEIEPEELGDTWKELAECFEQ